MGAVGNSPPRIREDFRREERVTTGAGMPISGGLQSAGCVYVVDSAGALVLGDA
jgi:hypothetical protein